MCGWRKVNFDFSLSGCQLGRLLCGRGIDEKNSKEVSLDY
jgi:hypothetical protein